MNAHPQNGPYDTASPTAVTYGDLNRAYAFFNERLFGNELPPCLITLQRRNKAMGYFAPDRFWSTTGKVTDEIALNPSYFAQLGITEAMQTLVHEMAHLWQKHFGQHPPRRGYHNKEWGAKMKAVGLHPSSTGKEGGKETGQKVADYIITGGPFEKACAEFNLTDLFGYRWDDEDEKKKRKKKNASKTPFECQGCGLKAWAKASALLACSECSRAMICVADDGDDDSEAEAE